MDWSFLIFVVVIVFFAYRGYRKGLLKSLSRVLSLVAGYAAAILFTAELSKVIEASSQLQGVIALITASIMLFFGAGIVVSLIFWLIGKALPANNHVSVTSSLGGTAVGILAGTVVAVIIVWTFNFLQDMRGDTPVVASQAPTKSIVERMTNKIASRAVSTALSLSDTRPEITQLGSALIESPGQIAQQAQRLANSQDLADLLTNPGNQTLLNNGDIEAVKALPAFQKLADNPDLLALARSTGMIKQSENVTDTVNHALATQLTDIWQRMQRVKNNKRVQQILNDPEFQQKIQSANPVDLLSNTQLLELADIIFEDKSDGKGGDSTTSLPKKAIYSWTDKNGKVHYSDQAPE